MEKLYSTNDFLFFFFFYVEKNCVQQIKFVYVCHLFIILFVSIKGDTFLVVDHQLFIYFINCDQIFNHMTQSTIQLLRSTQ